MGNACAKQNVTEGVVCACVLAILKSLRIAVMLSSVLVFGDVILFEYKVYL